jgi:hypothetical protein
MNSTHDTTHQVAFFQAIGHNMETMPVLTKKFLPMYERREPTSRDHSSVRHAKSCKRKYFFMIVLGFIPKGEQETFFAWGQSYHIFRKHLELSGDVKVATDAALAYFRKHGDVSPTVGSKYDFLTIDRFLKTCLKAYKHWETEKQLGRIEVIPGMIEQMFDVEVTVDDLTFRLSGKADQVVRWNGKIWGRDWKTSSKTPAWFERNLDPNDQVNRYTMGESILCGEQVYGQIIECVFNDKKNGPDIKQFTPGRTKWQLDQWLQEQAALERELIQCRETDIWPSNEDHCPYCPFHSVCKRSTEGAMAGALEQNFVIREHDPRKFGEE